MRRIASALRMALAATMVATGLCAEPKPKMEKDPAGIRTDFGDVQIENLGIGRTYNLRDLAGTPLKVTNTGVETVNLLITAQVPGKDQITKERVELGYKPIPNPDWVSLSQSQFIVPSGESAYTDVIITIPNDPALYGKKFQASIYSRTTGTAFLQIGVWSHLHLSIAASPEAQAEIEKNRKRGVVSNMDYTLLPDKLFMPASPGKTINIRAEAKKTLMIANSGENPIKLRVRSVRMSDTPLSLQNGFEAGDAEWLHVAKDVVTVDAASFTDPQLTLVVPKDAALIGKKLMFVLKVEPADPDVVGVTYYGKIYVEVSK